MNLKIKANTKLVPVGYIEPHASMLRTPDDDQLLYKIMSVENLLKSIDGNYLHFNRVDSYSDFPGADEHDGEQLPTDRDGNKRSKFVLDPGYSIADYYDCARSRTYACCFCLENSPHMWSSYGNGGTQGKVCLVFNFGKLRARINQLMTSESTLLIGDNHCLQIFSVNYGNIEYVDWDKFQLNVSRLPNPIQYTYLKDRRFVEEKEHRIALSAFGMGEFVSNKLGVLSFPQCLQLSFDFKKAASDFTLYQFLHSPDCNVDFLHSELQKFGFDTSG